MKKPLRVAMIAPPWLQIPPNGYGGIENVIAALVPELIKLGVEVELFTTGDSTIHPSKRHYLFRESQYKYINSPQHDSVPISVAHLLYALNKIEQDGSFDIIHDHNNSLGPLALAFTHYKLPPSIHTLHNPRFVTYGHYDKSPDYNLMWHQLKNSDKSYFVGMSRALTRTAPPSFRRRMLKPIHNGVDVSIFPFVEKKENYFITLARFHPEKGQSIAAKLCAQLGYRLCMAGVVGDITTPRKLSFELVNPLSTYRSLTDFRYYSDKVFPYTQEGEVEYVGEVNGQRKLNFISRAKALLFPIQWEEPFGMAPLEALACGTPVVAMDRGAVSEIIRHGENGFLARSEGEFKKYLKLVDQIDPAICRKSVEDKFSAARMAREYLKAYKKIIAQYAS